MSGLHGRPTAGELTEAVRELLDGDDAAPTTFQRRVAANALRIVERELAAGGADERAHIERLRVLGFDDDAGLAAALRHRRLPVEFIPQVRAAVLASVQDKLRVANPGYLVDSEAESGGK